MGDILERLRSRMVGHPHAKIPWPHRDLHDAADTISALRAENEVLRAAVEELRELADDDAPIYVAPEQRQELQTGINSRRAAMLRNLSGDKQDG